MNIVRARIALCCVATIALGDLALSDNIMVRTVSSEAQLAMQGGQCYDGQVLDQCPSLGGDCSTNLCVDDQCPESTFGYYNSVYYFGDACSTNYFGYDDCVETGFVCYQKYACFGCQLVSGLLVCNVQGGTGTNGPYHVDHTPQNYGCSTY